ncbi:E3 ubiquitin-protein ligase TRIM39-like [Latimeria chalumnae]|uniref:E3 ubiquitin-protein ligase TRIM39-like n=1 Tax=Latimeria chalumnae TaxID=7897 RepID=UPI00313AA15A
MDSKSSTGGLEDEMTCSICQELFKDPVTTKCGHNFCRECVCQYWKGNTIPACPICRADAATSDLITLHTLRNVVEMYKKEGKISKAQSESVCSEHEEKLKLYCLEDQESICVVCQTSRKHKKSKAQSESVCSEHEEELKLYCLEDQESICVVCQASRIHENHKFLPIKEAAQEFKEKEEKEEKMRAMEESIVQDLTSVSKMIKDIQQKLDEEDQIFLMTLRDMRERIKEYADYKPREPEAVSAADLDGYKYTDGLQYRVWKKMQKIINRVMVTLDPHTAHPNLTLSEDLTAVTRGSTRREDLPDNPERFDQRSCVLGSEGFTSGRHSWVVDVEKQTYCRLGVAAESANRKGDVYPKPERGYWTVRLFNGGYSAVTDKGPTQLDVLKTPKKVLVCVDYEAGKVSFSNADDMSHIYTFTHKFKHKIFPFFWIWTAGAPLRICNL